MAYTRTFAYNTGIGITVDIINVQYISFRYVVHNVYPDLEGVTYIYSQCSSTRSDKESEYVECYQITPTSRTSSSRHSSCLTLLSILPTILLKTPMA